MPSPTSTTVPTDRVSTPASNWSMADLMIVVMSSERMAICYSRVWVARGSGLPAGRGGCGVVRGGRERCRRSAGRRGGPGRRRAETGRRVVCSSTRPPVICSRRAAERGHLAGIELCGTGRARLDDAGALVVQAPELARDARQRIDSPPTQHERQQVAHLRQHVATERRLKRPEPDFEWRPAGSPAAARSMGQRPRRATVLSCSSHASTVPSRSAISNAASA